MNNLKFDDIVIISDWHLGFPASQINKINNFLDFLITNKPIKKLILNGDIFDLNWEKLEIILTKNIKILKKLVKINQRGTDIIYILGNHDPLNTKQKNKVLSIFNDIGLNNISILPAYQLKYDNRIYLINHGHMFDTFISEHKIISDLSDIGYRLLIGFDNIFKIGLTQLIIYSVRKLFNYSKQIEKRCKRFLKTRKYSVLLMGHTHIPKMLDWKMNVKIKFKPTKTMQYLIKKQSLPKKTTIKKYCNSGDWVEPKHCTYLIINQKGEINLKYFS